MGTAWIQTLADRTEWAVPGVGGRAFAAPEPIEQARLVAREVHCSLRDVDAQV